MTETIATNGQPPVDHLSHSSMGMLLRNPLAFKKKYILKIYDSIISPSSAVGQACHKAIELYLKGECSGIPDAIHQGSVFLQNMGHMNIDFGKTGSLEKMLKDYNTGISAYFAEMPDWDKRELISVEESVTTIIKDHNGEELSLPAKCYADVVWRSERKETFEGREYPKGSVFIEDNKFVRGYTDSEDTDPTRLQQAFFNFLTWREKLGEQPVALLYRETKFAKNSDGTPQSQYYVIDWEEVKAELPAFVQLYNDVTRFLMNPDSMYLPNPSDMFDGKDSWLAYRQNLITAEAPVIVHKTEQKKFVEKRYIPTAEAKVENRNLTQEELVRLKLQEFGIPVEMQETHRGSSVIMYTCKPSRGVAMSSIEKHAKDLQLALKAKHIRVQAPITGTDLVGIEVPNERRDVIPFMPDGVPDPALLNMGSLTLPIGRDVYGNALMRDLRDMPHLLVAGTTNSGKSVFLNVAIRALTAQNSAAEMQMMLFDPKRVELTHFADQPHLISDIITETEEAQNALLWLNEEMDKRYSIMQKGKARNILEHNQKAKKKMPYLVVVIDEFADLVLTQRIGARSEKVKRSVTVAAKRAEMTVKARQAAKQGKSFSVDVSGLSVAPSAEEMIVRLAQKGRAAGIHLIIATQHPVVSVVTGIIKANMPARVAFATTSEIASKVILDEVGAEELTGAGDMLYLDPKERGVQRLQGFYA